MGTGDHHPVAVQQRRAFPVQVLVGDHVERLLDAVQPVRDVGVGIEGPGHRPRFMLSTGRSREEKCTPDPSAWYS